MVYFYHLQSLGTKKSNGLVAEWLQPFARIESHFQPERLGILVKEGHKMYAEFNFLRNGTFCLHLTLIASQLWTFSQHALTLTPTEMTGEESVV